LKTYIQCIGTFAGVRFYISINSEFSIFPLISLSVISINWWTPILESIGRCSVKVNTDKTITSVWNLTRGCQRFPCLALFAGVWFYFSLLSAVFSLLFDSYVLLADNHVNNVSYFARQKNHVRFTGKCMLYSLCQPSPQFSMLFLFKINNTLYISFQSLINTQILTISHIIT
jgi:hypothetical protein